MTILNKINLLIQKIGPVSWFSDQKSWRILKEFHRHLLFWQEFLTNDISFAEKYQLFLTGIFQGFRLEFWLNRKSVYFKWWQLLSYMTRNSTTDHWTQESIKRIFNSGLFWAVGAAEKKIPTAISMLLLRSVFYVFMAQKIFF